MRFVPAVLQQLALAWVVLAAAGCTDPVERSYVVVTVDADSAVRERVEDVQIMLQAQDATGSGWQEREQRDFMPNAEHMWPLGLRREPEGVDYGGTYQLTATARNAENAIVAQARVIGKLERGKDLLLVARFEAACFNRSPLCSYGETCRGGNCIEARDDPYGRTRAGDGAREPAADGDPELVEPSAGGVAQGGTPCEKEDARACGAPASRMPLLCQGGVWRVEPECPEDQRCDTERGTTRGLCRPIARECMNKQPDEAFCAADESMLVCADLVSFAERNCGEHERCVMDGRKAKCDCKPGFVKVGDSTVCSEATSCGTGEGGCDPLTRCFSEGGTRKCGPCPAGFSGDGTVGCSPLLTSLVPTSGKLEPAFSPDVLEYTIKVPMLVQRLGLSVSAPQGATISLNGSELAAGGTGQTQVLKLGSNMAELVVSTERGVPTAYKLAIERTGVQEAYLKASGPGAGDCFGYSVAVDGDVLVVGAWFEDSASVDGDETDNSLNNSGAVYVFERSAAGWAQKAYLKPNDPRSLGLFGTSVAVAGDTIVVGAAEFDAYLTMPTTRPGAIYVFTRSGGSWTQTARLTARDGRAGDALGSTLALSGDLIAAGASRAATSAEGNGAVYLFKREGGSWSEVAKLQPSVHSRDARFGLRLALAGDTLVSTAYEEGSSVSRGGAAYVFEKSGEGWREVQRLEPPTPVRDATFGAAVALHGKSLAISAPRADWSTQLPRAAGEVFVYERGPARWTQSAVLKATNSTASDRFGWSLAMSESALYVGAIGDGSGDRGVSADPAGGSAEYSGAVHMFAREGGAWIPSAYLKSSNSEARDGFGYSLAFSDDTLFVSAHEEDGAVGGVNGNMLDNRASEAGAVYTFR